MFHRAAEATWQPWRLAGYEYRDTGIGDATDGVAGVRVVRPVGSPAPVTTAHAAEFVFTFVLDGAITLQRDDDEPMRLSEGDSFVCLRTRRYTLQRPERRPAVPRRHAPRVTVPPE